MVGAAFRVEEDGSLWSPISKNIDAEHLAEIKELLGGETGDLLMFLADTWDVTCKGLAVHIVEVQLSCRRRNLYNVHGRCTVTNMIIRRLNIKDNITRSLLFVMSMENSARSPATTLCEKVAALVVR